MAKKKSDTPTDILGSSPSTGYPNPVPVPQTAMPMGIPGQMLGYPMAGNPLFSMMQMMQTMMAGGAPMAMGGMIDPSAVPFAGGATVTDEDTGLQSDIIRPMLLKR